MSAGAISLESAIRTCKVDTAWASRVESDRFLNPSNMVCPVWNGMDSAGRKVCPDSFYTKRAGCNSAEDRVTVENSQRPQYMEYITLSAGGIDGNIYKNKMHWSEEKHRSEDLQGVNKYTGNFGLEFGAHVYPGCSVNSYKKAMSQEAQNQRQQQSIREGYQSNQKLRCSGF